MSRWGLQHVGDLLGLVGRLEALQESKLPAQQLQDGGYSLCADVQGRLDSSTHIPQRVGRLHSCFPEACIAVCCRSAPEKGPRP